MASAEWEVCLGFSVDQGMSGLTLDTLYPHFGRIGLN